MRDPQWIVAFPLEEAMLCVNCENIGNRTTQCVVCLSSVLIPLAKVLNRPQEKQNHDKSHTRER